MSMRVVPAQPPLKRQRVVSSSEEESPKVFVEKMYKLFEKNRQKFIEAVESNDFLFNLIYIRSTFSEPFSPSCLNTEITLKRTYTTVGSISLDEKISEIFRWVTENCPRALKCKKMLSLPIHSRGEVDVFQYACIYHQVDLFTPTKEDFNREAETESDFDKYVGGSKPKTKRTGFGLLFQGELRTKALSVFVKQALDLGVDPNNKLHLGNNILSLLHRAVLRYDAQTVKLLLAKGHRTDVECEMSTSSREPETFTFTPMDLVINFERRSYRESFPGNHRYLFQENFYNRCFKDMAYVFFQHGHKLPEKFLEERAAVRRQNLGDYDTLGYASDIEKVWQIYLIQQEVRVVLEKIFGKTEKTRGPMDVALDYVHSTTT